MRGRVIWQGDAVVTAYWTTEGFYIVDAVGIEYRVIREHKPRQDGEIPGAQAPAPEAEDKASSTED